MIGILPAAGHAERFGGLPKYLLPVADTNLLDRHSVLMADTAQVTKLLVGANLQNTHILRDYAPPFATVYTVDSGTMSETVLAARKYGWDEDVLFGMPDSYFEDDSIYNRLAEALYSGFVVVVGVFECLPHHRKYLGMMETLVYHDNLMVIGVHDKPERTDLQLCWGTLAWRKEFWEYVHPEDPHVGFALARAIQAGVSAVAVAAHGLYYDCGTAERYFDCIRLAEWEIENIHG